MKRFDKQKSIREILNQPGQSAFKQYKALVSGDVSFGRFWLEEFIFFFLAPMPGALGFLLRQKIYPVLFNSCGKKVIVGRNCTFRHITKMNLGDNVTIDDGCVIDARGCEAEGLKIGNNTIIARNVIVQSKSGDITIGNTVNVGSGSMLISWDGIELQDGVAMATGCHLSAGNFDSSKLGIPVTEQESYTTGPIIVERNSWLATGVTLLDGVNVGHDSIVSAGSIVSRSIPPCSVVHGNPAKVIFTRR